MFFVSIFIYLVPFLNSKKMLVEIGGRKQANQISMLLYRNRDLCLQKQTQIFVHGFIYLIQVVFDLQPLVQQPLEITKGLTTWPKFKVVAVSLQSHDQNFAAEMAKLTALITEKNIILFVSIGLCA